MKIVRLSNKLKKTLRRSSGGFTLIEVLVALALFAIIGITFAGGLATSSRTVLTADVRTNAESLARTQMEYVKEQQYEYAPDVGVSNYTKTTGIPELYTICSVNRDDQIVNCGATDDIIGIPWDSGDNIAADIDDGLQKITLVIMHEGREIITLEGYKVDR